MTNSIHHDIDCIYEKLMVRYEYEMSCKFTLICRLSLIE